MNQCIAWVCLAGSLLQGGSDSALSRYSQSQPHMGVEFEVVLYAPDRATAEKGLAAAFDRIKKLDETLSDYRDESELSQLSASSLHGLEVKVSDELWQILSASRALSARTEGAFDITIGPLSKLWRRARRQRELPSQEQIDKALAAVGYQHLQLNPQMKTAKLLRPQMRLDAGGIAKGYAAEEALIALRKLGITRALVRASGDIAAGDAPPGENGWRIGVAPLDPDQTPTRFLLLKNAAVSTSGDARQHLIVDGKRYSHLIDPRTGYGISSRSSVTVIAPHGIDADSLASAVSILGPEKGLKLIEETKGAALLMIVEQEGAERSIASNCFTAFEAK